YSYSSIDSEIDSTTEFEAASHAAAGSKLDSAMEKAVRSTLPGSAAKAAKLNTNSAAASARASLSMAPAGGGCAVPVRGRRYNRNILAIADGDDPWAKATFGRAAARSSMAATARSARTNRNKRRSAEWSGAVEMKRLSGGNLRAAGYDEGNRVLRIELTAGTFDYSRVTPDTWRRFIGASSPWSFFRDNIEEEYPAKRVR